MKRRSFFSSVIAGLATPAATGQAHKFTTGNGWVESMQARSPSAVSYINLTDNGSPVMTNVGADTNISFPSSRISPKGRGGYTFNA